MPTNKKQQEQQTDDEIAQKPSSSVPNMMMMEGLVNKFDGQDATNPVSRWTQEIDDNAEIFSWTPSQTLLMARRSLTGTAALWLRAERVHKTWDELKKAIEKEFPDAIDVKTVHEMMSSRFKKSNESCIDYMLTMKELGKRGKMPDYVAIKYIVDGIRDNEINKMMLHGVTTYNDLKEKLKIYESIKEKMKKSQVSLPRPAQVQSMRKPRVNPRCYSCGDMGHVSAECPHKQQGMKCFHCNRFGHVASECRSHGVQFTPRTTEAVAAGGSRLVPASGTGSGGASGRSGQSTGYHGGDRSVRQSLFAQPLQTTDGVSSSTLTARLTQEQCDGGILTVAEDCDDRTLTRDNDFHQSMDNVNKAKLKKPMKLVKINEIMEHSLIDSGSDVNLISSDFCETLNLVVIHDTKMCFSGLGKVKVQALGMLTCNIVIDDNVYNVLFYVVPSYAIPYKLILGQEFLKNVFVVMDGGSVCVRKNSDDWLREINCFVSDYDILGHITNEELRCELKQCIDNYTPLKIKEAPLKLKFVLKDDVPIAQRPRRVSLKEQIEVERQVEEWLHDGIIEVSYSDYSSPLVLVKKKDGSTRICVDYRLLNRKIIRDAYPLPIIEDCIDKLAKAKIYCVLDLKNGFFHLKVSEECIKYTSFVSHHGQFHFLRAPFGLSVCPQFFMRYVSIIFRDLISRGILQIFIDDIVISAENEYEALERLKEVLKIASEYGLQINWKKAQLLCKRITYLGYVIEGGSIRPSKEKVEAVMKYPEPRTIKQLHSFIGLASYFRKFIPNFAIIARPLTELLKKGNDFVFDVLQRQAFMILKEKLSCDPVLKIFRPEYATELHTDASSYGYSAILMQLSPDDNELHPVYYMSRKTTDVESRYSSYELEALAIIEGIKKFRHYLFGIKFKIVTDCKAFQMTMDKKNLAMSPRVARWVLFLQDYDYQIEHREGTKMKHVDALSRQPYVCIINDVHENIRQAQMLDEGLKAIMEILKDRPYGNYMIDNNLLYIGDDKRLVIPRNMERDIIQKVHSKGHFSIKKMKELINKDYYIKGLDKKIEDFILTCIPCLLATKKEGKQEGFLNPIEKESIPLMTIHLDHVGPLTQTSKQYNYILTVVDAFTKFVWLFPTKSTSSKETLNKLQVHQQTFGNPQRIITDRGTAFTSGEFAEYCKEENIQHLTITTGVPRGNGQVERIHRIIIPLLTKLCLENSGQWYKHVSRVQRAINSTFQRSIKTTPFELLIGTKMRTQEDIEIQELLQEEERQQFNEDRESYRKQAKEQILKIQDENVRDYNKKRKESSKYEIGDVVATKRTQFGTGLKLKPKYLGPYRVIKVKRNDRYDLEKIDSTAEGPGRTSSSADHMKRWPAIGREENLEG